MLVVPIHGNTDHFDALAGALAGRYAVHAPDLRGFGASTYERRIDSVDDLVGDAARLDRRRRRLDASPPGGVVGGRGRRRPVRRRVQSQSGTTATDVAVAQRAPVDFDYATAYVDASPEHSGVEPGSGRVDDDEASTLVTHGDDDGVTREPVERVVADLDADPVTLPDRGHSSTAPDLTTVVAALKPHLKDERGD